jgi:hypothetical protein
MARSFHITTASESLRLDSSRQGEISFTVSNALGRPVRSRAVLEPEGQTQQAWLSLVGPAEKELTVDGTHSYSVRVAVPPEIPEGAYSFHLIVASVANPDEEYARGPSVGFQVPRLELPRKKKPFPWWIPAAAAGAVLLLGLGLLGFGKKDEESVLRFNGTNSFVDLANPTYLNFSGPITLEAWIRPLASDGFRNILAHGYTDQPPGEVFLRVNQGKYEVGSWKQDGAIHYVSVPIPAQDLGQWVHLAGVYTGSQWILYRNGMQEDSVDTSVGAVPVSARWSIGARGGGIERFFWGDIRDVRIWDRARSQEEIKKGMKKPPKGDEEGLIGYWPLEEGKGTTASDLSKNKRSGLVHNALWQTRDTPPSLNLNGMDSYIALPGVEALDFSGPITIEAWIQPLVADGQQTIAARLQWNPTVAGVLMFIDRGAYKIVGYSEGLFYQAEAAVPSGDLGKWVHLAGVYDGSRWILYRNGEQVASTPAPVGAVKTDMPWTIGAVGNSGGISGFFNYFFKGGIRDVRIWAKARTQEEIRMDMKQPPGKSEEGLAGYWPMDEGTGSTVKDHAVQANGTIHNGRW